MKAAIYNRFWASMGGGERHSAMIAQVLSRDGIDVDLIGHTDVSLSMLGSRLGLDLSRTRIRVVPDRGDDYIEDLSAEYALFINATYMSRIKSRSRRSAFLCFFPTPVDHDHSALGKAAIRILGPHVELREGRSLVHGTGWYPPEGGRRRKWVWSNGEGHLLIGPGPEQAVTAEFGRPGSPGPTQLTIDTDGDNPVRFGVDIRFRKQTFTIPASNQERMVTLRSEHFSPGTNDTRELGVAMSRLRIAGGRIRPGEWLGFHYPWLRRDPDNFDYLSTYDVVLANSVFTQGWITKLWHVGSEVIYPPIEIGRVTPAAQRAKTILSVGRFFAPEYGHSKRQLEIVEMFGRLVKSGQLEGWKLVIIGGCEPTQKPYLERVRRAALGLPVEIHVDAPRSMVEQEMTTASIFWSATGLSEDVDRHPWRSEHFGMTTVEAMAGGCVPVVIDRAGQRETVRQGVDGFRWNDEHELRIRTIQVATDDALRERLATSAILRAKDFSDELFAKRWRELADTYHLLDKPTPP